jgi:hypothetical protein
VAVQSLEKTFQPPSEPNSVEGFAFPHRQDSPAQRPQLPVHPFISNDVLLELSSPELDSGFWRVGKTAAWVPMPETAVNKNRQAVARQGNVWLARQVTSMKSEAIAQAMERAPDGQLRCGIPLTYACHVGTALRID